MKIKPIIQMIKESIRNEGGLKHFLLKKCRMLLPYICIVVRYTILLGLGYFITKIFDTYKVEENESTRILETLITSLGIFLAIIITYFFSKLYSERSERIVRKQRIDEFSIKITAVRRIAALIKSQNEFWDQFANGNLRYKLDTLNRNMTLPKYLNLTPDEYSDFSKKVGEIPVQPYLSIKYLESPNRSILNPFSSYNHRNYSLYELETMQNACGVLWRFFDRSFENSDWDIINPFFKKPIVKNLKLLYPNAASHDKALFVNTFSDIQTTMEESFHLTYLNNISIIGVFGKIILNVSVFMLILLSSIFLLNINLMYSSKLTNIIISLFIVNMIDFLINLYQGIKKDLQIDEIYKTAE